MFKKSIVASGLFFGLFLDVAFAAPPLVTSSEETVISRCLKFDDPYQRLLEICQQALDEAEDKSQRSRIFQNIGYVQQELKQFEAAENSLKQAIALDGSVSGIHDDLGWLYWEQERYEEAKAAFQRAVDIFPSNSALSGLANIERRRGEGALAALELIDAALAIDPEDAWALRERGWCLFNLERFVEAQQAFQDSLTHDPGNSFTYYGIARAQQLQGEMEDALNSLNHAVENISQPNYTMLARRSSVLRGLGKPGAAIKDANRAIELDPSRPWAHVELARAQDELGRRSEALKTYENAVHDEIESNYLLYWYADLLSESGRNTEALGVIEKALKSDDVEASDHELHAYIALELEDYALAARAAQSVIELDSQSEYGHYYAALAYASLDQVDLAMEHLDTALKLDLPRSLIGNFASHLISEGHMLKALQLRLRYQ